MFTSYLWSAIRIASNAIIIAVLYRYTDARFVGAYLVVRTTVWLLNYLFTAVNPVLQHHLAEAKAIPEAEVVSSEGESSSTSLDYAHGRYPKHNVPGPVLSLFASSLVAVSLLSLPAVVLVCLHAAFLNDIHPLATFRAQDFAIIFGIALLVRLCSEPASAMLQARDRLDVDNWIQIVCEILWILLLPFCIGRVYSQTLESIGVAYFWTSLLMTCCRFLALGVIYRSELHGVLRGIRLNLVRVLLVGVATVSVGQFADFLYAPANILLINRFVDPSAVARYAPALQIDAGLLLLVGAVSSVMLPRATAAWARGDRELLRHAYIRSTLACLFVLACAAIFVGVFIEPILTLWLGTVPPDAAMITRLVLIHTVIGGTAGVGRSVLLGMGRFKAYTISALVGGIANVSLALLFALVFDLGLRGIVLATVTSVTVRCAVWMPWYILKSLRAAPDSSGSSLRSDAGV